jgi:hypothetical protein
MGFIMAARLRPAGKTGPEVPVHSRFYWRSPHPAAYGRLKISERLLALPHFRHNIM